MLTRSNLLRLEGSPLAANRIKDLVLFEGQRKYGSSALQVPLPGDNFACTLAVFLLLSRVPASSKGKK